VPGQPTTAHGFPSRQLARRQGVGANGRVSIFGRPKATPSRDSNGLGRRDVACVSNRTPNSSHRQRRRTEQRRARLSPAAQLARTLDELVQRGAARGQTEAGSTGQLTRATRRRNRRDERANMEDRVSDENRSCARAGVYERRSSGLLPRQPCLPPSPQPDPPPTAGINQTPPTASSSPPVRPPPSSIAPHNTPVISVTAYYQPQSPVHSLPQGLGEGIIFFRPRGGETRRDRPKVGVVD